MMYHTFSTSGLDDSRLMRSRKACVQCRKRKQRCITLSAENLECVQCRKRKSECSNASLDYSKRRTPGHGLRDLNEKISAAASPQSDSGSTHPLGLGNKEPNPSAKAPRSGGTKRHPLMSRFVGHLNPETHLLTRTRPSSPDPHQEDDHLGIWFAEEADMTTKAWPKATASLQRYLRVVRDFEIPDDKVCDALSDIYFSTIHRFIPLVDQAAFRQCRASGNLPIALLLAVLLGASRDHRAKPYLRFPNSTQPLQTREFAQRIYTHLTSLLKADAETDKVTLIQVHALMSLHCEGPTGNEIASLNLVTAIHHLQVVGMHLPRADEADRSGAFCRIFWSMWSLDRLNAAYNGRPTIIHEQDMAHRARFTCSPAERHEYAPFLIWLKLTALLDKTIAYYRPVADPASTGWELGFPSFEEIISAEECDMPVHILYVLEIYYNSIAILTSRYRDWNPVTASNAASIRQALSTLRLLQIIDDTDLWVLPALPIIPYAMTLCLSVTYRQCRAVGTVSASNRARRQLTAAYSVLEELATQWWFAEAMAKLGRKAMARVRNQSHDQNKKKANYNMTKIQNNATNTSSCTTSADTAENSLSAESQEAPIRNRQAQPTRRLCVSNVSREEVHNDNAIIQGVDVQRTTLDSAARNASEGARNRENSPSRELRTAVQQEMDIDYDLYLLDSIPNLVYPESGMADEIFNDISLFDGFETGTRK